MASAGTSNRRFLQGHHALMIPDDTGDRFVPIVPSRSFIYRTFGQGIMIWSVWPAVLFHTTFASVVVSVSMKTNVKLDVPPVLLTVLGVVIGFVISYRVSTSYSHYWLGRTCWSDMMRNARGMSRVIWFHVPPRLSPFTAEEIAQGMPRNQEEMLKVMAEKRMALDMIEGLVAAVKHHLRGEIGIYYEDLYHLVQPLHEAPQKSHHSQGSSSSTRLPLASDPMIPAVNVYGTFDSTQDSPPSSRPASRESFSPRASRQTRKLSYTTDRQNVPLAILRCLSDWVSVLDARATMTGSASGGLYTYISGFEDNLSTLETILTSPLPFFYCVYIRNTVWIYLFFLPFQLIDQFGWTTIPGVTIAAFIYLGFIAAAERIEQPGDGDSDLDLDLFREIFHEDIHGLKGTPCLNAYLPHRGKGPAHRSIVETSVPREQRE